MNVKEVEERIDNLGNRVKGINTWIKENPQITDPNVYEIMDCNIQFAEYTSKLNQCCNQATDKDQVAKTLESARLIVEYCNNQLGEMEQLRNVENHPFFQSPAANHLYTSLINVQAIGNYEVPEELEDVQLKRELLCKSMSVPFYIWQVQRNEPDYQYDNVGEYQQMKDMLSLYKATGNTQFVKEVEDLFTTIEKNYKYSETKKATTK